MSASTSIELTPVAQQLLAAMTDAPARLLPAIAAAMDDENKYAVGHIHEKRMYGKGPFDVSQHRLGHRTGNLGRSLRATPSRIVGDAVESSIGTNLKYMGIHEFGGTIKFKPRSGSLRLRTNAKGELLRQSAGRRAIFAKGAHKRATTRTFTTKGHEVEYPERAPIRTGIADLRPRYTNAISKAVIATLKGGAA